jgi:hypothetical protein
MQAPNLERLAGIEVLHPCPIDMILGSGHDDRPARPFQVLGDVKRQTTHSAGPRWKLD